MGGGSVCKQACGYLGMMHDGFGEVSNGWLKLRSITSHSSLFCWCLYWRRKLWTGPMPLACLAISCFYILKRPKMTECISPFAVPAGPCVMHLLLWWTYPLHRTHAFSNL